MFLESLFLYVWMECPKGVYNQKRGRAELLQKNWKTILYLLDEAQFVDADTPPKLDLRQAQAPEEVIKSIIRPEIEEGQVLQKKKMWMEMEGK